MEITQEMIDNLKGNWAFYKEYEKERLELIAKEKQEVEKYAQDNNLEDKAVVCTAGHRITKELGYSDLENSTVKCADCGRKLLQLQKVKSSDEENMIQVKCPCGGESFKVKLTGKWYFAPVDKLILSDIVEGMFIMMEKR